ncbi:hypothetical protein RDI58_022410 [Solanum bulbocastanum]|uniref:RNase H type-1 domain-containing protein n=1 Tax=Solanum bulbocastanum TaxID=147425 RepID=A0AAN8T7Q8_SOLBU
MRYLRLLGPDHRLEGLNLILLEATSSKITELYGGVARNDSGNLIMAFSVPIQCKSNNQAEAMAAMYGIYWCKQTGFNTFELELDSLLTTDMINNKVTNNLRLKCISRDIIKGINGVDVKTSHCFRKANQVASFLSKQASSSGNGIFFYSFQHLPKGVKGLFQQDRWQLPSIRRRYDKCDFFVS